MNNTATATHAPTFWLVWTDTSGEQSIGFRSEAGRSRFIAAASGPTGRRGFRVIASGVR